MKKHIKQLKRLLALTLSLALLATTMVFSAIPTATASGEDETDTHEVYSFYRHIDFSQYTPKYQSNVYGSNNQLYITKKTDDSTADGGAYLRYDSISTTGCGTWWEGNHMFAPSHTGTTTDIILPEATTFRATFRIRTNDNSMTSLNPFVIYGASINIASDTSQANFYKSSNTLNYTSDWTEFSFTFTTPEQYLTNAAGTATYNKCFLGFLPTGNGDDGALYRYSYDIDYVTLAAINDEETRVIDFVDYNVNSTGLWGPSQGSNTLKEDTWAHIKSDSTMLGGKYFEYDAWVDGSKGLTGWAGHYNFPVSVNGSAELTGDMTKLNNIVLPTNSKYRISVKLRLNKSTGTDPHLYWTFTSGQTSFGEMADFGYPKVSDGWKTYEIIINTPSEYTVSGTSTLNKLYLGVTNGGTGDFAYDIDYIKLQKIDTVTVTFNANGGSFGEAETSEETVIVGDAPAPVANITAPDKTSALIGWATSADSTEVVPKITKDMEGTTLYAVWSKDPHVGGYNAETTVIDFKDYTVINSVNSYTYNNGTATVPYWTKNPVADNTTADGNYLRYEVTNTSASWWLGNHSMAPSVDGTPVVLPNGVTYKITVRMRTKVWPGDGFYPFVAYCDSLGRDYRSYPECQLSEFKDARVSATNGEWTECSFVFTTPESYLTTSGGLEMRKFYMGFYNGSGGVAYSYDVDTITIEEVTATNFYIDSNEDGEFELFSTVYGVPGKELNLPASTVIKEAYNTNGTGYTDTYNFDKWYSDDACTQNAILKYGNFDVNLYCKPTVTRSSTEGQLGFVGFDQYFEYSNNASINTDYAAITDEEAYSGTSSLKLVISAGKTVATEIKNNYNFAIKNGQSYRITLMYKTDAAAQLAVGLGELANVAKGKNISIDKYYDLTAGDNWQKLSFIVDATNPAVLERGYTLALVVGAQTAANVYVDTITVSAVTDAVSAVKTENGIRFMMSYNCGGDDVMTINGQNYTILEHGILVTGADNETALILENAGVKGIVKVNSTDTSKYFARNAVTKNTIYSVLVNGLDANDTYKFKTRGYVKFTNGDVYYTDFLTASASTAKTESKIVIPDEGIRTGTDSVGSFETTVLNKDQRASSYFLFLPAGTTFYSDKQYKVERWTSPGSGWISPNFERGTGTYVLATDAYCELTIWNGTLNEDITITIPAEDAYRACGGFKNDFGANEVADTLEIVSDSAVNYIFISDVHTGAYLRKDPTGTYDTVYEAEDLVNARENHIINTFTEIVDFANNNDNIDFIVVGGDIVNGYETPHSPMYQAALAAGKVNNIREFIISQMQAVFQPLKNSTKPVFIIPGNHDDNAGQSQFYAAYNAQHGLSNPTRYLSEIVSDRDWYNGVMKEFINVDVVQDTEYLDTNGDKLSKYYYYDFVKNGEKKRVILLDAMDTRNAMNDETGEILEYNGSRRMAYSDDELRWLANVLASAEGDVIMFSHQPMVGDYTAGNSDVLSEILAAYQNKTTYTNASMGIDVDFSSGYGGHITSFHTGHTHLDATNYASEANIWQIVSSMGTGSYDVVSSSDTIIYKLPIGSGKKKILYYAEF